MCTTARIKSIEGNYYWARTMDFAQDFFDNGGEFLYFPAGQGVINLTGESTTRYSVMGMGLPDTTFMIDGINSEGLVGGSFYFEEATGTTLEALAKKDKQAVVLDELVFTFLSQCATVEEVATMAATMACLEKGTPNVITGLEGHLIPLHMTFTDEKGQSVVLEPDHDGELSIYMNTIGTMANSPTYPWHMTNLRNYVNLSDYTVDRLDINNLHIKDIESGSGLLGLPGDYTSPSRFVRISMLTNMMAPVHDGDAIRQLYTAFNSVIIPKGIEKNTPTTSDYTAYWIGYDLKNRRMELLSTHTQTFTRTSIKEAEGRFNGEHGHIKIENDVIYHLID